MHTFTQALQRGMRSAAHIPTLLPLWLSSLILGIVQTWPLWLAGGLVLRRPFLGDFATGGADTLIDLFLRNDALTTQLPIWIGTQIPVFMIQHLVYAICAGGMLSVYLGKGRFGSGSRRYALAFIGLDIILIIMSVLFVGLAALGMFVTSSNIWIIVAVVLMIVLGVVGEYARAIAVVRERRNPFIIFGQALSFCVRHLPGIVLLALLASLLLGLVLLISNVIPGIPSAPWLMVMIQQLVILALVWIKALRLAWAAHYVAQASQVKAQGNELSGQIPAVA